MSMKMSGNSKFGPAELDNFLNESKFLKRSPKKKIMMKRQRHEKEEENNSRLNINTIGAKKKKTDKNVEVCRESRQKLINVMSQQIETRKKTNENFMKSLAEVITLLETDYNVLKDNEQKLEHLTGAFMKCIQQATIGHKQILKALKEIQTSYKKECEEMEADHKEEANKLGNELEEDIKELQQKLISETKRSGWETLSRTIFQAMQNDD